MKKIISLLLVVCCLLLCLTSCANPETLVTEAMANTQALDAYEAELKMDITMTVGDEEIEMPIVMDMKIKGATTDHPVVYMKSTVEMMGEKVESEIYMDSEWVYMLQDGVGYKMSVDDAGEDGDVSDTLDDMFQDMPESVYEDVKAVKNGDGSKTVSLSIPDSMFEEVFSEVIESVKDSIAQGVQVSDVIVSNAKVNITVKDKYISAYEIMFDMAMQISGVGVTATAKETLTIKNMGDTVTVTPMQGYQSYTEIS